MVSRRRVPFFDTILVKTLVWLACALPLVLPIVGPRLITNTNAHRPAILENRSPRPSGVVTDEPPSSDQVERVPDRLSAILGHYGAGDTDIPASARDAGAALQWCARRIASYTHASASDASRTLSLALSDPRSDAGVRVVDAIEAPALGANERLRMQCAALLYGQLRR